VFGVARRRVAEMEVRSSRLTIRKYAPCSRSMPSGGVRHPEHNSFETH
jgi:hypothetical protein